MRFVIIASTRTGSSHLVNTLGGHPEIFCHGNVFAQHMMAVFWPRTSRPSTTEVQSIKNNLRELREKTPDVFLEHVFSMNFGRPHVGFKIFRGQNDAALEKLIADSSVRKIILFRRNVLANYSSAALARETKIWDVEKGKDAEQASKIEFDEHKFIAFHNNFVRYYRNIIVALTQTRQNFHFMNYEEINDPGMLAAAINFIGADGTLGVDYDEMKKIQIKQNTADILSRFTNPDGVETFLASKGLLHWKYEGEISLAPIRNLAESSKDSIVSDREDARGMSTAANP